MKNKKGIFVVLGIIVLGVILFYGYKKFIAKDSKPDALEIKKLDNIVKYEYSLYEKKSDLYKEYFDELKKVLNEDVLKEENYAGAIAKLFATDFYSLKDKLTSNDIGGLDFIFPDLLENLTLKASDTLYYHVESNVRGNRKQELPKVTGVEVSSVHKQYIEAGAIKDKEGYVVDILIKYEKELGYPKNVQLKMIHKDIKLYIVEVKWKE